ncbi:MAG: ribosome small subunit-dependent GTPase A [Rhodoferax sp.]
MPEARAHEGLVVASHGRHVWVECADGQRILCHPRGKKNAAVVGDHVRWAPSGDEGSIEAVLPRRNLLYRQDDIRTKTFAANIDQVLVLVAAEPEFSEHQLARALIAAEAAGIAAVVALNKQDLGTPFARAWQRLAPYRDMGYTVLPLALRNTGESAAVPGWNSLLAQLQGRTTLVLGPSGAGKSTLINRLVPQAQAATNSISVALNSGKHTTTSTTLYWLDELRQSAVLDSPGFQEFGLGHIAAADLASWMPDIRAHARDCRFYNCSHLHEPGCGVRSMVKEAPGPQEISATRYKIYSELVAELSRPRY